MPTMGAFKLWPWSEPWDWAWPKGRMPPAVDAADAVPDTSAGTVPTRSAATMAAAKPTSASRRLIHTGIGFLLLLGGRARPAEQMGAAGGIHRLTANDGGRRS